MLDGDASYEYEELNDCSFGDEQQLDKAIEIALLAAQREEERRSNVENKASLFIGAFSLAVTIFAYSARTAHPFQRNGAPFRFKLSKAQQVD